MRSQNWENFISYIKSHLIEFNNQQLSAIRNKQFEKLQNSFDLNSLAENCLDKFFSGEELETMKRHISRIKSGDLREIDMSQSEQEYIDQVYFLLKLLRIGNCRKTSFLSIDKFKKQIEDIDQKSIIFVEESYTFNFIYFFFYDETNREIKDQGYQENVSNKYKEFYNIAREVLKDNLQKRLSNKKFFEIGTVKPTVMGYISLYVCNQIINFDKESVSLEEIIGIDEDNVKSKVKSKYVRRGLREYYWKVSLKTKTDIFLENIKKSINLLFKKD